MLSYRENDRSQRQSQSYCSQSLFFSTFPHASNILYMFKKSRGQS
uniref:Uncharacterized protein n=1 Tax=Rhizophora mucronata TaxID=61149 RepID=A0A2P2NN38_RHIMU